MLLDKPSEVASHTSALITRFIPEYLDPRSYSVVEGGVEETTTLLSKSFLFYFIFLTLRLLCSLFLCI
jgi:hypothetical protein